MTVLTRRIPTSPNQTKWNSLQDAHEHNLLVAMILRTRNSKNAGTAMSDHREKAHKGKDHQGNYLRPSRLPDRSSRLEFCLLSSLPYPISSSRCLSLRLPPNIPLPCDDICGAGSPLLASATLAGLGGVISPPLTSLSGEESRLSSLKSSYTVAGAGG